MNGLRNNINSNHESSGRIKRINSIFRNIFGLIYIFVQIVLSAALAIASASVATVYTTQHDVPIGYTTSIEPKSSYEYQASVQTQDYNNYQSVKSVDPAHGDVNTPLTATTIEAQPAIIAEQPAVIAARTAPVVLPNTLFHAQQPVVVASQPQLIHTEAAAPAVIAARTVYDATPIVEETIVEAAPALQPVIRPIVRTAAPLIKTVQPATVYTSEPVVAVKTVDPTIYAGIYFIFLIRKTYKYEFNAGIILTYALLK